MAIDLVAVLKSRLHDTFASADLIQQAVHVRHQVLVDIGQMGGDDGAQQ
jgi:hypothetical protein